MAKRGVNKVIIMGNVGGDPEVRTMNSGDQVATLSIATSEVWNDKQTGEKKEQTEWHRITFWRKSAEIVAQYVRKGDQLYVEGKLQTRKYVQDGVEKYATDIIAEEFRLMGKRDGGQGGQQQGAPSHSGGQQRQQQQRQPAPQPGAGDFDDDIPF